MRVILLEPYMRNRDKYRQRRQDRKLAEKSIKREARRLNQEFNAITGGTMPRPKTGKNGQTAHGHEQAESTPWCSESE